MCPSGSQNGKSKILYSISSCLVGESEVLPVITGSQKYFEKPEVLPVIIGSWKYPHCIQRTRISKEHIEITLFRWFWWTGSTSKPSRPEVENILIAFSILELVRKHVEVTLFWCFWETGSWKCYQKIRHTLISRKNILVYRDMVLIGILNWVLIYFGSKSQDHQTSKSKKPALTTFNGDTQGIIRFLWPWILIWVTFPCLWPYISGHLGSFMFILKTWNYFPKGITSW